MKWDQNLKPNVEIAVTKEHKQCTSCKSTKLVTEFRLIYKKSTNKYYLNSCCKIPCELNFNKNRVEYFKQKKDERIQLYHNCSEFRKQQLEYNKEYHKANREKIYWRKKEYVSKNKESLKLKRKERNKKPLIKLRSRVSGSINTMLKKNYSSKFGKSCLAHLSYTIIDLKKHLESQFEFWMNWDNWGRYNKETWSDNDSSTWVWHIDHIIPQSKLSYDTMDHPNFTKCWELSNLRPLSAKQNLLKSNNII